MMGALRAGIALLGAFFTLVACGRPGPSVEAMVGIFHDHRSEFELLQQGLCADAARWVAAYPDDPRGPAYALVAANTYGPWLTEQEKAAYSAMLHDIGAAYAVVEDVNPDCVLNIGYWSAPVRYSGGYVETKAWLYGDHWRRKALPVTSNGQRPHDEGRPKGVDAVVFRAEVDGRWGVVTYRTRGQDY